MRILYIEDNDYLRELTTYLLEAPEREVIAVASAEEGWAEFERKPVDVVITDVSLPVMSGIDFAKRVLKAAPHTWIIIASGYKLPVELEKLGSNVRALPKPFEAEQIDALLSEVKALP